ncbi:MAG: VOC family protein [Candidatus Korobacteraceae bacterium]
MLDHILLGCSDLDQGMAFVEQHTGVRPAVGGVHPGRGTRNALLSLGEMHYLEVIAPDPAQASLTAKPPSMLYTLRHLDAPRIVTWAAHTNDMNAVAERLRKASIGFEGPTPGSRKRPDGRVLNWQTLNLNNDHNGLLPFFIQWGAGSVHPSVDAPAGCRLERFEVGSMNNSELAATFRKLGIEVDVEKTEQPRIIALIIGPRGKLDLR